jgi:hypothetical protein
LFDDGTNGDITAGDRVLALLVPSGRPIVATLPVSTADARVARYSRRSR